MNHRLQRVLVLFSSVSGCTTSIAHRIGADLIAYGVKPVVYSVGECPLISKGDFDAIILGSGTRLGRWHRDMRDWLDQNKALLESVPVACFTVGLHGIRADGSLNEELAQEGLERIMNANELHGNMGNEFFPGWKRTEGFSSMERIALRVYPLAEGDYRDWDRVDAWVREIAPELIAKMQDNASRASREARASKLKASKAQTGGSDPKENLPKPKSGGGNTKAANGDRPPRVAAQSDARRGAGVAAAEASESADWRECYA
jgi:menaquinone-dependent protoporphyrinogen oxidase